MDCIVHYVIDIPPMMEVTEEFPFKKKKHEQDGIDGIDSSECSNGGWQVLVSTYMLPILFSRDTGGCYIGCFLSLFIFFFCILCTDK